jgi:hypothetical protein
MRPDDHEKYTDLLDLIGELRTDFQAFKSERVKTLNDVEQRLSAQILTYWTATAAAIRQLSNWHATTEDRAVKERTTERWVVRGGMAIMIALLLLDIYLRSRGP